ncbi:molybdenum cofactor guanylyltransferase [Rhodobacter sp.]
MRIFGIILAGGQGRRMGTVGQGADKALLPLAGRPLIAHVCDRLEPQVEALAVSANGDPARLRRFGLPVLADDTPLGPLAGILQGLLWAGAQGADALVSAPVDAPFLPGDLTPRLILAADGPGLALARSGGRLHPTFGLWPVALAPDLAGFLASGAKPKVMDFALSQGAAIADFPDDGAFSNLNTPEDLAAAAALIGGPA